MAGASFDWPTLLRRFRASRGLKQEAAAAHLGVSQATISRWERGEATPTIAVGNRLLRELGAGCPSPPGLAWAATFRRLPYVGAVITADRTAQVLTNALAARIGAPRGALEGLTLNEMFKGEVVDVAETVRVKGGFTGRAFTYEACVRLEINPTISRNTAFYAHYLNWPHLLDDGRIVRLNQGVFLPDDDAKDVRSDLGGMVRFQPFD